MDILSFKGYEGTVEVDMSTLMCRGKLLFIDDLVTYEADTPSGLQKEFELAVDDYLETCASVGKEPQRPFKGQFNVRVPPDVHRSAALRAAADAVSLNEVVVSALRIYLAPQIVTRGQSDVIAQVRDEFKGTAALSAGFQWKGATGVTRDN